MNPELLLNEVEEAILGRNTTLCGPWRICYLEHKIQCIAASDPREPEIVFVRLTTGEIVKGFSAREWYEIGKKVGDFWRQKKL